MNNLRMMRGPYCDEPITMRSGAVVTCGSEVAPGEAKYYQCEMCWEEGQLREARLRREAMARRERCPHGGGPPCKCMQDARDRADTAFTRDGR